MENLKLLKNVDSLCERVSNVEVLSEKLIEMTEHLLRIVKSQNVRITELEEIINKEKNE